MLIKLLLTILIIANLEKTEPSSALIKETRERIAEINISFLKNNYPETASINELGKLLNTLKKENELPKAIAVKKDFKNRIVRLIESYKTFEKFYQDKPEVDTLKKVFRLVNNGFNSLFGNYFLEGLKKSSKKKIILFSTSMSCECTLEMCYKQEAEIQKLQNENPDMFDYAVVDCFTNFDLQSKYEIGFIPTVIVLNSKNKEVKRFMREELEINKIILGE